MPSIEQHVGYDPPRIEDLIAPPSSVGRATSLGLSNLPGSTEAVPLTAYIDRPGEVETSMVPDFAEGRGGDGIGGIGLPTEVASDMSGDRAKRREREQDLLGRLRRILGW